MIQCVVAARFKAPGQGERPANNLKDVCVSS
jgi:hypothetical protein